MADAAPAPVPDPAPPAPAPVPAGKPETLDAYHEWARDAIGVDFTDPRQRRVYESNITSCLASIQESDFLVGLTDQLRECHEEYKKSHKAGLLMTGEAGDFELNPVRKSYDSAVNKTFRKNVLLNENFPAAPAMGWLTPSTWYSSLNDLVRSTIVCKFIDGPQFLSAKLEAYATNLGLRNRSYSQERDEGYYAYHFYAKFDVTLVDLGWNEENHEIEFEIQLATQLQDVLKELTHAFYEATRIQVNPDKGKWKWDFKTNRFRASYLSHTLHLLEAIVVDLRDEGNRERKEDHGSR
jgi:ppGpp synthetase/RelA/SpoT-type nucleotidyltranferase